VLRFYSIPMYGLIMGVISVVATVAVSAYPEVGRFIRERLAPLEIAIKTQSIPLNKYASQQKSREANDEQYALRGRFLLDGEKLNTKKFQHDNDVVRFFGRGRLESLEASGQAQDRNKIHRVRQINDDFHQSGRWVPITGDQRPHMQEKTKDLIRQSDQWSLITG
jgi:hypothetical protein